MRPESVYLVGMAGSGKSSIGPLLAEKLEASFFDIDNAIVSLIGLSIPDIFTNFGEAAFRKLENEVLLYSLSLPRPLVVSCGGGVLGIKRSIDEVWLAHANTIYLEAPAQLLAQRVVKDRQNQRPLFQSEQNVVSLTAQIERMLLNRASGYRRANRVVAISEKDKPAAIVETIIAGLLK